MKSPLPALIFALLWLCVPAFAQEQHNSLAVDDELVPEAGPYYFIEYGDSSNAFAKAAPLAKAMGLELSYDNRNKTLTFSGNGITARMLATSDVNEGLVKRSGVLDVDGRDIASPMAIIVDGVSYVPVTPLARAFECDYAWHAQYRLITVDMPMVELPEPGPQPSPKPDPANEIAISSPAILPPFRVGIHEEFTRVAIDLGAVREYGVAVGEQTLVVTFSAAGAEAKRDERTEGPLSSAYYSQSAGSPALVIETRHGLSPEGRGFRLGRTAANTLYIDVAPHLTGEPVAQLAPDWRSSQATVLAQSVGNGQPLALAPAQSAAPTVVLDAGHGGKFAGSRNGDWHEEDIVLAVTLLVKDLLEQHGVEVILTRDEDEHLSNDYVGDLAARAGYATPERNLFVSIHTNSVDWPDAHGIETFVFGEPLHAGLIERAIQENGGGDRSLGLAVTNESIRVANETSGQILRETQLNYSRRLARSVQESLVRATGAVDRGVKQNALYVLRNARTPAILVELGFVSNPVEGRRLASREYQEQLARALVDGILEFLTTGGTLAHN